MKTNQTDEILVEREENSLEWVENINPATALFRGNAYRIVKRILDLTLALLILPIVLPLIIISAAAIKIENLNGPIIYSQLRTGRGGNLFKMYKFRTMVPNADELKEKYAHLNELEWPDFKIKNDPRITKIGKVLRKTSMDELPQIFNILAGDMSIVGPRPTSFGPERYNIWHTERFDVLPGVTGLWQIAGRGEVDFDDKLRLDILYIKKRCLMLDILILIKTVPVILKGKGSY
jgi:lipopolysaccharide/colanic/teichoic acid biosynthesis glycosyltransferase